MIGSSRWVFPHSAKRSQLELELKRAPVICEDNLFHSLLGEYRSEASERDAVHVRQHTDSTGVYLAYVNDSHHPVGGGAFESQMCLFDCKTARTLAY